MLNKNKLNDLKILSITDSDIDGACCQIIIGNVFNKKNITYLNTTKVNIDNILENTNKDCYDYIFITDIAPSYNTLVYNDLYDKIILIDHHETNFIFNDVDNFKFIDITKSSALATKKFFENLGVDLSYLNDLVNIVNDYDLGISNEGSFRISRLYHTYKFDKFKHRFFQGYIELTDNEKNIVKKDDIRLKNALAELVKNNLVEYSDRIKSCILHTREFINELSNMLLGDNINIVFTINHNNNISIRSNCSSINVGNIAKKYDGGGHKYAAGISATSRIEATTKVLDIIRYLYKDCPSVRI